MRKLTKISGVFLLSVMLSASLLQSAQASEKGSMMAEPMAMASVDEYTIDSVHSTIGFAVKHLQVSNTRGHFTDYNGTFAFDADDYSSFKADVVIKVGSINTSNEARDKHLRGPDFFDAELYSEITFTSSRLEKRGKGAVLVGYLTIKDVTKQLTIPVQISGPVNNPHGGKAMGLAAKLRVNRQEYHVQWSKTMDNGGMMVDDWVDIIIELELHSK